jgi:hypothetical protein
MKTTPPITAGFFVARDSLTYFATGLENVNQLALSSEIMTDLEIVSQNSLERVIVNWLEQYKIVPTKICLVLDESVYFNTTLEQMPAPQGDPAIQEFLDILPFDDVLIKNFPLEKGAISVAVNQNFLKPLVAVLEKVGFQVLCIAPAFVLNVDLTQTPFNPEIAKGVIEKIELLNQYNLMSEAEVEAKVAPPEPFLSVKFNPQLIGLIVLFVVLIAVLVGLLIMQKK